MFLDISDAEQAAWLAFETHPDQEARDAAQPCVDQLQNADLPFRWVKGTHFQAAFGHVIGYDAGVYSYLWSLAHAFLGREPKRRRLF